jgi:dCMP deaminase
MKRKDYISWDELFMGIAELASKRSKDPDTRHGSCIVKDNKVLSIGYNGLPSGFDDNGFQGYDFWEKPTKYDYACHSEENAIINAKQDLTGCVLYLFSEKGYYPCSTCARMIVQSGIKEIIMKTAIKKSTDKYNFAISTNILTLGDVNIKVLSEI